MTAKTTRVLATFRAAPGREEELARVLEALIEPTRAEPGCLLYELWKNRKDAAELTFVEEWASAEALAAHGASAHIAEARDRYTELIVGELDLRLYDGIG